MHSHNTRAVVIGGDIPSLRIILSLGNIVFLRLTVTLTITIIFYLVSTQVVSLSRAYTRFVEHLLTLKALCLTFLSQKYDLTEGAGIRLGEWKNGP